MDTDELYRELIAGVMRHARSDGEHTTAIPALHVSRKATPGRPLRTSLRPCFALVVQGAKSLSIGSDRLEYGIGDFLIASVEVPVVSRVTVASAAKPNLGIGLVIEPERLANVFARLDLTSPDWQADEPALAVEVNRAEAALLDPVVRLLRLLDHPDEIAPLAPLYKEEILYRLLTGPCRSHLVRVAKADTPVKSIAKATRWFGEHFAEPFKMDQLARYVGMSVSSLHHHFKAVTGMSPLQYQKQLRLNEARRLLLVEAIDVGTASQRVGYQSASQFTREYTRMFGLSPRRDVGKGTPRSRAPVLAHR